MPLADTTVRKARPADKRYRLFDEKGLYLEVAPTGGKWWRFKYRFAGKEKRLSLGTYPEVPLKVARERRDRAREQVAAAIDPGVARKAQRQSQSDVVVDSFEVIAREWSAVRQGGWSLGDSAPCAGEHLAGVPVCGRYGPSGEQPGARPEGRDGAHAVARASRVRSGCDRGAAGAQRAGQSWTCIQPHRVHRAAKKDAADVGRPPRCTSRRGRLEKRQRRWRDDHPVAAVGLTPAAGHRRLTSRWPAYPSASVLVRRRGGSTARCRWC